MLEPPEEELPPFTGTVLDCLDEPLTVRELVRHPDVRLALALTRIPLADAGLLGYPRLGANRAARRRVEFLRERHPLPRGGHGLGDEDTLLAVALHGEAALRVLMPRFARRAGLLSGPGEDPEDDVRPRRRGRFRTARGDRRVRGRRPSPGPSGRPGLRRPEGGPSRGNGPPSSLRWRGVRPSGSARRSGRGPVRWPAPRTPPRWRCRWCPTWRCW
ncbi:hypothetical protein SFUMM280S_00219 [Streptomyces fumanus]